MQMFFCNNESSGLVILPTPDFQFPKYFVSSVHFIFFNVVVGISLPVVISLEKVISAMGNGTPKKNLRRQCCNKKLSKLSIFTVVKKEN